MHFSIPDTQEFYNESTGSTYTMSQNRGPKRQASQAMQEAEGTLLATLQRLNEIDERRQGALYGRDKEFLAFLGSQLNLIKDEDILDEVTMKILIDVLAAKKKQREMNQRQQTTINPVPETMYPTSSTQNPYFSR